jgi:hypothetical protein
LILAARLPHFSVFSAMSLPNSAGESASMGAADHARFASRSVTCCRNTVCLAAFAPS